MIGRIKQAVRSGMRHVAGVLDRISGGKITPNSITLFGFAMHVPTALLIAGRHTVWAAVLLAVFGLFDTLDGALARLQKRESAAGMLLDSITDRMKEILLYTGLAYAIIAGTGRPYLAVWAVAACGCSLLTSYINAWGDAVMAKLSVSAQARNHAANQTFRGGLFPFEIRMVVLITGLLSNRLALAAIVITVGAAYTALSRLVRVYRNINRAHAV